MYCKMEADKFSSICVFCCKTFKDGVEFSPTSPNGDGTKKANSLTRFLLLFQRHLSIKKSLPEMLKMLEFDSAASSSNKRQIHTCSLCSIILSSFCDIYHQKEILNLQIQWKLQTLVSLMTLAGRVTSRIKILKRFFDEEADGYLRKFMDFRKELIRLGSHRISRSLPRVHLRDLSLQCNNETVVKTTSSSLKHSNRSTVKREPEENTETKEQIQYWIMSFAAVVSLTLLSPVDKKCGEVGITTEELQANNAIILEDVDETTNDLPNDTANMLMEDESDNEIGSTINSENGSVDSEQKVLVQVNDAPQLKKELVEQDNDEEVDSCSVDIRHYSTLEGQRRNTFVSPTIGKISPCKQLRKPFACAHFPSKYARKTTLTERIKKKYPGNKIKENAKSNGQFLCKVCSRQFATYRSYIIHTKRIDHRLKMKKQSGNKDIQFAAIKPTDGEINEENLANSGSIPPSQSIPTITPSIDAVALKSETDTNPGYNLPSRRQITAEIKIEKNEHNQNRDRSQDKFSSSEYSSENNCKVMLHSVRKRKNKQVVCPHCPKKYTERGGLGIHIKNKHPEKIIVANSKVNGRILCKICNTRYTTYPSYIAHTKRTDHRRKMKRQARNQVKKPPAEDDNERDTLLAPVQSTSKITVKMEVDDGKKEMSVAKLGYNLRTRKSEIPVETLSEDDENSESSDDESSSDDYSSTSSNESDNNVLSSSATVKKEKNDTRRKHDYYRCRLDSCHWETWSKLTYQNHKKLHETINYACDFCDIVEANAVKISMHEISEHSEQPPPRKRSDLHQCPRCPYQSKLRFKYINHFAWVHLNIKRERRREGICPICHVEVRNYSRHFKIAHDTSDMDPTKIIKCSEKDCTVEFSSTYWLRRHRREHHKMDPLFWSSSDEDDDDNDHQMTGNVIACKFCEKTFIKKDRLERHKHYFHNKKVSTDEITKSCQNAYICPSQKCSKSYKRKEILDKHIKLHGKFQCQVCDVVMEYAPDLSMHELEHSPVNVRQKNRFKCSRCTLFTSPFKGAYITHFLEIHLGITDEFYECSVCKLTFKTTTQKKNHFSSHHKTENVDPKELKKCTMCPAYFLLSEQLQSHQLGNCAGKSVENSSQQTRSSALSKLKYHCEFQECTESFKMLEELEAHQKLHGQFKCKFCQFEGNYAANLAWHEMEHAVRTTENRKAFNCSRCSYSSATSHTFKKHFIEKHLSLDPKVIICVVCKTRCLSTSVLRRHFGESHNIKDKNASKIERCDVCPAYFLRKVQLISHKRKQHDSQDYFECKDCNKTYSSRKKLRAHFKNVHKGRSTSISGFPCDNPSCKRRFENEDDLILHKKFGHGEQDYKMLFTCDKCGKELKGVGGLKNHTKQMHHKDRPTDFKCDQCSKVFNTKIGLQNHQEFHKGPEEWKFMCEVCSKKCVSKYTLKVHMNIHTKAKPFVCQICGKKYAHRHNLRNHVNAKHKDEGVEDIPKKINRKYFVSRKGKKLGTGFCFTRDGGSANDVNENSDSDTN